MAIDEIYEHGCNSHAWDTNTAIFFHAKMAHKNDQSTMHIGPRGDFSKVTSSPKLVIPLTLHPIHLLRILLRIILLSPCCVCCASSSS